MLQGKYSVEAWRTPYETGTNYDPCFTNKGHVLTEVECSVSLCSVRLAAWAPPSAKGYSVPGRAQVESEGRVRGHETTSQQRSRTSRSPRGGRRLREGVSSRNALGPAEAKRDAEVLRVGAFLAPSPRDPRRACRAESSSRRQWGLEGCASHSAERWASSPLPGGGSALQHLILISEHHFSPFLILSPPHSILNYPFSKNRVSKIAIYFKELTPRSFRN